MISFQHFKSGSQSLATRFVRRVEVAVIGITVAGTALSPAAFGQTVPYSIAEIQGPGVPNGLNNLGDVAGRAFDPSTGEGRATKWNHGRLRQAVLGNLVGGDYSAASKINDLGQVAGAGNISSSIVPFVWTSGLGFRRIPVLPGDNCGQAAAINRFGHVVGYSSGPQGRRAFLWTHGNTTRDLGLLPGSTYSTASDLNDSDEVVGTSGSTAGERAVLWTSTGAAIDLGTLPGDISSAATAINNNGTVIGYSKGLQGMRAFVWTRTSGMEPLGTLPGETSSRALGINDANTVVGSATTATGDRAFVWTKEAGIQDLNNEASPGLGVVLVEAHAINRSGQILALGMNMHEMEGASPSEVCAPAPPASFLLTPP